MDTDVNIKLRGEADTRSLESALERTKRKLEELRKEKEKQAKVDEKAVRAKKKYEEALKKEKGAAQKTSQVYNTLSMQRDKENKIIGVTASVLTKEKNKRNESLNVLNKHKAATKEEIATLLKAVGMKKAEINATLKQVAAKKQLTFWQKMSSGQWTKNIPILGKVNTVLNNLRWTMVNVGFAIAAVVAPLIMAGKTAIEFGLKMERVAVITGRSAKSIQRDLLSISRGTLFNIDEVADAYTEFVKLGFGGAEGLEAMKPITDLATAGFADLATATRITGQIMQQFDIPVEDVERVVNLLARGANMSAAEVESFGEALSYVGGVASIAGLSLEETGAIIAQLTNAGMTGSRAGTSLAAALNKIINPTREVSGLMNQLNLDFFDSVGNMKDFSVIVTDLSSRLAGFSQESQLDFLASAFGTRGGRAVFTLINQYRLTGKAIEDIVEEMENAQTAAETTGEVMLSNAARAKAAYQSLASTIRTTVTNAFNALGNTLADFLDKITELEKTATPGYFRQITSEFGVGPGKSLTGKVPKTPTAGGFAGEITDIFGKIPEEEYSEILRRVVRARGEASKSFGKFTSREIKETKLLFVTLQTVTEFLEELQAERFELSGLDSTKTKLEGLQESIGVLVASFGDVDSKNFDQFIGRVELLATKYAELEQKVKDGTLTDEEAKAGKKELEGSIKSLTDEIRTHGDSVVLLTGIIEDFWKSYDKLTLSETELALKSLNEEYDVYTKKIGENVFIAGELVELTQEVLDNWYEMSKALIHQKDAMEDLNDATSNYNALMSAAISIGNKFQKSLAKQIKAAQSNISELLKQPFIGELEKKKEILDMEQAIREQRITILELGKDAESTSDKMSRFQKEYTAWVDTIKAFVRAALTEGRSLGKNVTGIVKKFQTQLIGISTFKTTGGAGKTPEEERLEALQREYELLKLEFDKTYTHMRSELQLWDREQQTSGQTLYSSIEKVKEAINDQRSELQDLQEDYDYWQDQIDGVGTRMDDMKLKMLGVEHGIEDFGDTWISTFDAIIEKMDEYGDAWEDLQDSGAGGGKWDIEYPSGDKARGGTITQPDDITESIWDYPEYRDDPRNPKYNDFILRPGERAIPFNSQDTIVGFKDGGGLGGNVTITLGDIIISGGGSVSDPRALHEEFAQVIRRELARIK